MTVETLHDYFVLTFSIYTQRTNFFDKDQNNKIIINKTLNITAFLILSIDFVFSAEVLMLGLGGPNKTDSISFVELTGEETKCPKVSKYPVKLSGSVGAFFNGTPLVCGGSINYPIG